MVLLLNYLPAILFIAALAALYHKWTKTGVGLILAIIVLTLAQPSYLPKGQPQRTQLEQFEVEELEMQDSLRAPALDAKAREERFHGTFNAVEEIRRKKEQENNGQEANR